MKISGVVKKYTGMGRKLGFPTANIEAPAGLPDGLYLGYTVISSQLSVISNKKLKKELKTESRHRTTAKLPSLIYIGPAETFEKQKRRLESYILDFPDRDLYGEKIEVTILEKLRDNRKFNSKEELVLQMQKDKEAALEYFKVLSS